MLCCVVLRCVVLCSVVCAMQSHLHYGNVPSIVRDVTSHIPMARHIVKLIVSCDVIEFAVMICYCTCYFLPP